MKRVEMGRSDTKSQHTFLVMMFAPDHLTMLFVFCLLPSVLAAFATEGGQLFAVAMVGIFVVMSFIRHPVHVFVDRLELRPYLGARSVMYSEIESEKISSGRMYSSLALHLAGDERIEIFVRSSLRCRNDLDAVAHAIRAYRAGFAGEKQ